MFRRWVYRIVVPMGSALFALVVAEFGLRVVRPVPFAPEHNMVFESDPDTGYRIKPAGRGRHASGADMAASSQGLRNREIGRKGGRDFRILVLGDSFTAGSSVERDQAYPQVLEGLLARQAKRPVEVINAGVGGWDPFQYAQYFARDGFRFEPDLVVVGFFVGNDTYSAALSVDVLPTALGGRRLSRAAAARWTIRWEVLLYEHSHLVRALRPTLSDYRGRRSCDDFSASFLAIQANRLANHLGPTPERVAAAQANIDQILRLRDRAAERNVPVVVALLPDENQVNVALQARLLAGKDPSPYDFSMPQTLLRERFEAARVPVIDLLPAFRSDSRCLYNNTTHWNAEGHVLAAEGIADRLVPMF
jgi:lysophospholipase L1-like esterase